MIRVLLVDDEKLALEYLENMISWEDHGFQLIGATTDAEQALKLYQRHKPELLISDVCMPGMSGLDLAGVIRENDRKSHILFLSGYKNFSYVKQAIRLGIDDYLLKSDLTEEMLLSKILKLKEEIEKEKSIHQYTTGIIMEELFRKNVPEQRYKELLDENEYIRIHKKYFYVVLSLKTYPSFLREYLKEKPEPDFTCEYEFRRVCTESSGGDLSLVVAFPIGERECLGILEFRENPVSEREISAKLYEFSLKVYHGMNVGDKKYNVYYYPKGCSVRKFSSLYREKKPQFSETYVKTRPIISEFGPDRREAGDTEQQEGVLSVASEEIYEKMRQRNFQEVEQYFQILKISIEEEDPITYLWYVKSFVEAMARFEGTMLGDLNGMSFNLAESGSLFDLSNPRDMVEYLRYKLEEIQKFTGQGEDKSYSPIIEKAVSYIQEEYFLDELSSNMVAKAVNLSPSWLSTKFKEEVGVGVSDYINSLRVLKAKELLDHSDDMIYEVAEKVGFTSSQYFSKIFKQFTGLTPNEYKRVKKNKQGGKQEQGI